MYHRAMQHTADHPPPRHTARTDNTQNASTAMAHALKRTALGFGAWVALTWLVLVPGKTPLSNITWGQTTLFDWMASTGLVIAFFITLATTAAAALHRPLGPTNTPPPSEE